MHHRLPWLLLLTACSSGAGGGAGAGTDPLDFTLRLRPLTPLNQPDLFDDVDSYTVTVDRGGEVEVYELGGAAGDGTVTTPEVSQLEGADDVLKAIDRGTPMLYTPGVWQLVMLAIQHAPRAVMRRVGF